PANLDFLAAGETITFSYTITATDDSDVSTSTDITFTITGTNDVPTVSTTAPVGFTEALDASAQILVDSGTITFGDLDFNDDVTITSAPANDIVWSGGTIDTALAAQLEAGFVAEAVNALPGSIAWTYNAGPANLDFLAAGETITFSYTITATDDFGGVSSTPVTFTITGTNDAPVAVNATTAATEGGAIITGYVTASDVDANTTLTYSLTETAPAGLTFNADGSYSFDPTNAAYDHLAEGATQDVVVSFTANDGMADSNIETLTITITGTNDAAVITGTSTAALTETNVALTTGGTLAATDVDSSPLFVAQTATAGSNGYGSFSIGTDGIWSYTMNSAHDEFVGGQNYTDSITVTTVDGTAQVVTVTITGTNDAAIISGTSTAALTETNTALTTGGTLAATDVDSSALFVAQTATAGSNGYGSFSIGTDGIWSYTMNSAHNEFVGGQNYTDSITVTTADGTAQVITVTITGTNDAPVFTSGTVGNVDENAPVSTVIYAATTTDVDGPAPARIYSLSGADAALLNISSDGLVTLKNSADFETKASYAFDVIASDGTDSTTQAVIVSINNINGEGPITIHAPAGNFTFDNSGTDPIFITGVTQGSTVTLTGPGTTTLSSPSADVTVVDTGTGHIVVDNPSGNVTVNNSGSGTTTVTGVVSGSAITATGTGNISIIPAGEVAINNTGTGIVTVEGAANGTIIHTNGTGAIVINTHLGAGEKIIVFADAAHDNIHITNSGAGQVDVRGDLVLGTTDPMTLTLNGNNTTVITETGTVNLGNAPLILSLAPGYSPLANDRITLINNDGTDAIVGTFADLPEGGSTLVDGKLFYITYAGGDGNDVVLHMNVPPVISGIPGGVSSVAVGQITQLPDFVITDENGTLNVTLTATNGTINGLTDVDTNIAGIQLVGTAAEINSAIAAATFTAAAAGEAHINMAVTDAGSATTNATYHMSAYDESQVPTPGGGTGDGNGDGIQDSLQGNVMSVQFLKTPTVSTPGEAQQTFITLVSDASAGDPDSNTVVLTKVQQLDAPNHPASMNMPLGLLSFSATEQHNTSEPSETFSLFVDSTLNVNGYWVQNATGMWENLATSIVTAGGKTRIDFAITDGGAFDTDHSANGIIENTGAAGSMPLSIVGAAPDSALKGFLF
ncbi:MAG TPA: hypothetical protein HPP97_14875, partial [Desulfuromonadales bacterium]|nr:hypothetical protein [Desulfuromonadales bacterium]